MDCRGERGASHCLWHQQARGFISVPPLARGIRRLLPAGLFWLVALFCHCSIAATPGPDTDTLAIRPTGIPSTGTITQAIADAAPPSVLTRSSYPEAGRFSARQIAQVLCGTPLSAYLGLIRNRNGLSASDLDKPLGDDAYKIPFPACLNIRVFAKPLPYVVKMGDTF